MSFRHTLTMLFQIATLAVAAVLLLSWWKPQWLVAQRPVVEIRTQQASPAQPTFNAPLTAPLSFAHAVQSASPAVVSIVSARLFDRSGSLLEGLTGEASRAPRQVQTGLGSGVIVSDTGYVLTNYHVIAGADRVQLMLHDGRSADAELVGSDPETDLAVLKIDLRDLPVITFGSAEDLHIGDIVLAIGNPFGVGQTVTMGIVSATGRKRVGLSTYENFIQTDAAINPGNSGGALVNTNGNLVGVNTAIVSRTGGFQGIGFAIPAEVVRDVLRQVLEQGHVVRGWLGISMATVTTEVAERAGLREAGGVIVASLFSDSPAEKAGLLPGDLITHIDRETVTDSRHLLDTIAQHPPGTAIVIEGLREQEAFEVTAVLSQRPLVGRDR